MHYRHEKIYYRLMATDLLLKSRLISFLKASKTSAFSRIVPVLLAGLSTAAIQSPAKALITNGSFEFISLDPSTLSSDVAGSTNITGWDVVGPGEVSVASSPLFFDGITFNAQDGNQWLDLTGLFDTGLTTGVTQSIPTIIGQAYNLQFYVGSALGSEVGLVFPSTVALSINGAPSESFPNPAEPTTSLDWKLFTTPFTSTSATTSLTFFNGNTRPNVISALDNVSVTAVPPSAVPAVPGPLPLLGVGSAFLWSRRLRNRIKGQR